MLKLNIENVFHFPMNHGYNKQDLVFFSLGGRKNLPDRVVRWLSGTKQVRT
jgi:hypothetical protein